tara:strand:+ start:475 stop:1050 length:576 start_codon:yes stop_codon:yes gene_type:complete
MDITKVHLKQIIEEELLEMMDESAFGGLGAVAGRMAVDLDRSTPGGISDKMRRTRKRTDNIVKYRTDGRFDHTTGHPTQPEDGKAPFQHGKSEPIGNLPHPDTKARRPLKKGDIRPGPVSSGPRAKVKGAEAAWRKRQRDRLADRGPTGARLRRAQEKALAKESQNDITKADLKRVIREELEAFLDDHYSK